MADSKPHGHLSVSPPNQISKDVPGPECLIPLSPQWLLPKPGENRPGSAPMENHSGSINCADTGKTPEGGEKMHGSHKKDVYRPTFLESESARRDRWRDEERDTNVSIRRDRWREGDKETGDTRKVDRWADSPPVKISGEARQPPSDRWIDPSKEAAFDNRRESKWNTRWGRDDKEMDKWNDSGKLGNGAHDKGLSHLMNHEKDDKEGDHIRPWRPSSVTGRGKMESSHNQSQINSKEGRSFGHGRGRGDNAPPTYSLGHGRTNFVAGATIRAPNHDQFQCRDNNGHGELPLYRYSRKNLLDLYRVTDMRLLPKLLDGFSQVPPLTQEEPVGPLALSALTSEELAVLKGIDQGDIVSSGAPQLSKDGPPERGASDSVQISRSRPALRDGSFMRADDMPTNRELNMRDGARTDRNWFDAPASAHARSSETGWLEARNELRGSNPQNELKQLDEDASNNKQQYLQSAPEDLILCYKDPHGRIQGPFAGVDVIGWFEAGYFGLDLLVRPANAPADSSFSFLGDVMPHLRAKARPPPGFSAPKPNEFPDLNTRPVLTGAGKVFTGPSGIDMIRNEQRQVRVPTAEAENRFLESLMSSGLSGSPLDRFSSSEGPRGYAGHLSNALPLGMKNDDSLDLLAKRLAHEQQGSLSNAYPNWSAKDASSMAPPSEMLQDSSTTHPKPVSTVADFPPLPSHPQNINLMSIPQGITDRPAVGINTGGSGWSSFAVQSGLDPFKDKIDLHNNNLPPQAFGLQQQRPQTQNHPPVANVLGQTLGNSSILTPESFLSSGGSQDPQILNLLHQQYLLQLQSQTSLPAQQLSLLDKMLLLQQQQKQEEQLRQQQQQLLSQVLTEHHQRFGNPPYGQLYPAGVGSATAGANLPMTDGSAPVDHLRHMFPQQVFQAGSQAPAFSVQEDRVASFASTPLHVSQESGFTVGSNPPSLHLPHQVSGIHRGNRTTMTAQDGAVDVEDSSIPATYSEDLTKVGASGSFQDNSAPKELSAPVSVDELSQDRLDRIEPDSVAANEAGDFAASDLPEAYQAKLLERRTKNEAAVPEQEVNSEDLPSTDIDIRGEQSSNEASSNKGGAKHVDAHEVRKTSEKKSRKQKLSKAHSSAEQVKGVTKPSVQQSKQTEIGGISEREPDVPVISSPKDDSQVPFDIQKARETSHVSSDYGVEHLRVMEEDKAGEPVEKGSSLGSSVQRGWKQAVNVKPKSLLEIQQEEARKVKAEIAVSAVSSSVNALSLSAPWAGVIASSEQKMSHEEFLGGRSSEVTVKKSEDPKKKSQLHDILAAEVLAKSKEKETPVVDAGSELPYWALSSSQADTADDDFIEAKDTKKSRKKAGRNKAAGTKPSTSVSSVDVIAPSPIEKSKSTRQMQQELREVLPAPSMGPSLGDFVPWKGESTSPSPAPAWSTDNGKLPKPTSLRDILKEQGKKGVPNQQQSQLTTPQKSQSTNIIRPSSQSFSGTSPSKVAAPFPVSSRASPQTKYKAEDDLFWGPPEHSKQEVKKVDFPQLGNHGSRATKSTPAKATAGASLSSQKSGSRKAVEISSSPASAQFLLKGKRDGDTKRSEAMEFRHWCETESLRLTGSKDTSFLEFCLKQMRSEAEILLKQNLGGLDPNHEFIDKLLNYMDMLPADVLNMAFQGQNVSASSAQDMASGNVGSDAYDNYSGGVDGSAKGGKKKGKKGKKVSPSVLGFNVVSNRIMMGDIQTVED